VPVHDRPEEVVAAVSSVLVQARPGVRVLVVDDGSTEPVAGVLAGDDRVTVLRIDHGGVSRARNAGVAAADSARWVAFLDSDDVLIDGWVDAFMGAFAGDAVLASCSARYVWDDGRVETVAPAAMWKAPQAPCALFIAGSFAVQRALFQAAGGYRDGLRHGENTDLGWRIGALIRETGDRVAVIRPPLVEVHARRSPRDPMVLLESAKLILSDPPKLLLADRRAHASYYAIAGVAASRLGQRREALALLSRAVKLQPGDPRHMARLARATVRGGG
jgi:glycosyltransferase involved in cell wall biosynthesis